MESTAPWAALAAAAIAGLLAAIGYEVLCRRQNRQLNIRDVMLATLTAAAWLAIVRSGAGLPVILVIVLVFLCHFGTFAIALRLARWCDG